MPPNSRVAETKRMRYEDSLGSLSGSRFDVFDGLLENAHGFFGLIEVDLTVLAEDDAFAPQYPEQGIKEIGRNGRPAIRRR